jgi:hypothetical protein
MEPAMLKAAVDIGPDGLLLVWGAIVSVLVALLAWRRVGLRSAAVFTAAVTILLVVWLMRLESTSPTHRLVATSFILVPSALLFGASRLTFLTRRPWVLLLLGPVVFVACFVGICECAYRLHLLGA